MNTNRRGIARIEVLAAAASGIVLFAATAAMTADDAPAGRGAKSTALTLRDSTHINQIHKAIIIFGQEFNGIYPRPGLINRLPIDVGKGLQNIPGRGEEDVTQNTTAALYAALITQNYFTPELVVSPIERNPHVKVKKDFNWDAYDPSADVYWDPSFGADLEKGAHASYAHLVMFGKRMEREWRTTMIASYPVLGNRGPVGGEPDVKSFTCGPHGHWAGNLAFNDNHVELLTSMTAPQTRIVRDGKQAPDNFFAVETGWAGEDVIISFTSKMTAEGPLIQHD